jgi:hypothetical protein
VCSQRWKGGHLQASAHLGMRMIEKKRNRKKVIVRPAVQPGFDPIRYFQDVFFSIDGQKR